MTQLKNERENFDEKQKDLQNKIRQLEAEIIILREENKKLEFSQDILLALGELDKDQDELNSRSRALWVQFCESSGKEVPLPALESGETVSERRESSDEPLLQELQALKERLKTLEDANSCPICQEQFDTEEARRCGISICGHQFCVKCLLDLLKDSKKSHCPSCRVSFQTNNIIYLF